MELLFLLDRYFSTKRIIGRHGSQLSGNNNGKQFPSTLLNARHRFKPFSYRISGDPQNNPMNVLPLLFLFANEETEALRA